jgi:hypothetical protein
MCIACSAQCTTVQCCGRAMWTVYYCYELARHSCSLWRRAACLSSLSTSRQRSLLTCALLEFLYFWPPPQMRAQRYLR